MFHEFLSFVVDNQEIYVRFHRVLFLLVNVIDVLLQMYEVFPKDNNYHYHRIFGYACTRMNYPINSIEYKIFVWTLSYFFK
jgi:hypothetical protein